MRQSGAKTLKVISGIDVHVLQVPEGTVAKQLGLFSHNPNVLYAEPDLNRIVSAPLFIPTEGGSGNLSDYFAAQWALNNEGSYPDLNQYGESVIVQSTADADIDAPERNNFV